MDKIGQVFVSVIITFFLTLILNSLVKWVALDNGVLLVEPRIIINNSEYYVFNIENYSAQSIDGFKLLLPDRLDTKQILTSIPISIEEFNSSQSIGRQKRYILSGFPGNQISSVFIPIQSKEDVDLISFENLKALKIFAKSDIRRTNPIIEILFSSFVISILYSIIFGIFIYFEGQKSKERDKKISELTESSDKALKHWEGQQKTCHRVRLLLLARLNDYAKELSFWRDTIRKTIYSTGQNKENADQILKEVQINLKTFKADSNDYNEFQAISTMADFIAVREKEDLQKD